MSPCLQQSNIPGSSIIAHRRKPPIRQIQISLHIRVVSLLTRVRETDDLLRPVPTFPGSIPVAGFRPGKLPSDRPHAYSAGHAGLFTPFRLHPTLTDGLCRSDDLSQICVIQFLVSVASSIIFIARDKRKGTKSAKTLLESAGTKPYLSTP